MKFIAALLGFLVLATEVRASPDAVTMHAMMILASNDPAAIDRRLEKVEYQLRRIFSFEYYHHFGEGEAAIMLPGQVSLDLGSDYRLVIDARKKDDRIRADVTWYRGDEVLLNTTVAMKRGSHVILGGVPHENGTLIITVVAE